MFITIETRHRAATLALLATIGLTLLKLSAALLSNSVGVLSEGVHSFLDIVSAAISYFTVREAGKPADEDHPFGHGKIETLSSLFESLLLVFAAVLIVYEGIHHLRYPEPIQHEALAIGVMIISMVVSFFIFKHNSRAAQVTESSALQINALHFLSDIVASMAVLAGLVVLKLTGWTLIDPILAFAVAAYILIISLKQVKGSLLELADTQLPPHELETLRGILTGGRRFIEVHDLRTRKSGVTRHIDFHLVVCGHATVELSHQVCDELEIKISQAFPGASVNIHVEPCEKEQTGCHLSCPVYQKK